VSLTATSQGDRYHVQGVQRAFKLLRILAASRRPMSLAEIARESGLHKSVCHRLLVTMADEGAIDQVASDGKYRIGVGLFALGQAATGQMHLASAAASVVRDLMEKCGESVYLTVETNGGRLCIAKADSPHAIRHYIPLGEVLPLNAGAGGKVLLAAYTREEFDAYIATEKNLAQGPNVEHDPEALWEALGEVRRQNVAWSLQERTEDGASIGVPIRDHTGAVVASLTIAGPASRFTKEAKEQFYKHIVEAGDELSRRLGFVPGVVPARWARGRAW
jgi:IclR family KDG regulon transcriptional repressor